MPTWSLNFTHSCHNDSRVGRDKSPIRDADAKVNMASGCLGQFFSDCEMIARHQSKPCCCDCPLNEACSDVCTLDRFITDIPIAKCSDFQLMSGLNADERLLAKVRSRVYEVINAKEKKRMEKERAEIAKMKEELAVKEKVLREMLGGK